MGSPENAFENKLHQDYIRSLAYAGYAVLTKFEIDPEDQTPTYGVAVLSPGEHLDKLNEISAVRHSAWAIQAEQAYNFYQPIPKFESTDILTPDLLEDMSNEHPEFTMVKSAWQALVDASELTARRIDNAKLQHYVKLDMHADDWPYIEAEAA